MTPSSPDPPVSAPPAAAVTSVAGNDDGTVDIACGSCGGTFRLNSLDGSLLSTTKALGDHATVCQGSTTATTSTSIARDDYAYGKMQPVSAASGTSSQGTVAQ